LVQIQKLTNYYAYDDGAAEVGYYLNTYGAKTAVRFTLNAHDTIKGLKIYFDPIVNGSIIIGSAFRIIIWADGGGGPSTSTVIYKDSLTYPQYLQGGYNLIPFYKLTSCLPLNAGTYYFGIQQQTSTALNIGFDRNTNHMDALYYDIGSGWTQSTIPGSLMINPVLGCYEPPIIIGLQEQYKNTELVLFPNPAQNNLSIKTHYTKLENAHVEILNSIGQSVLKTSFANNEQIDISELPNGIYFVLLSGSEQTVSPKKLIISR
jgi:hypothetical protein